FSFAHGGKDRHPFPVPLKVYDETIRILKSAVRSAKLGREEELGALRRLDDQARSLERHASGPSVEKLIAREFESSHAYNGFCVLRAKARGHRDPVTLVGHAATISAGEWITASGEWINDRTHGQQFKARFLRTSLPDSADGIEKYLSSGMIRGVGPVYAKKLVRAFGEKVFDVIEATPKRLREAH